MVSLIHDPDFIRSSDPRFHASESEQDCPTCGEPVPGVELPNAIYITVLVAFLWMLVASWYAFAADSEARLCLVVATGLLHRRARRSPAARGNRKRHERPVRARHLSPFTTSGLDANAGSLPAREAWVPVADPDRPRAGREPDAHRLFALD